jgi:hypothetical protein
VLLALGAVGSLVGALAVTAVIETRIAAATRDGVLALHAADLVVSRALLDLETMDWNAVLAGAPSTFVDGAPAGIRPLPSGGSLDLLRDTSLLTCGRPTTCSEAETMAVGEGREWGPRNPRWRLFAYGRVADLLPGDPRPPLGYVAAWVADDPLDGDGDPGADAALVSDPGHGVVFVAGRAYGPGTAVRTVQVAVQRAGAGMRILSRHERTP